MKRTWARLLSLLTTLGPWLGHQKNTEPRYQNSGEKQTSVSAKTRPQKKTDPHIGPLQNPAPKCKTSPKQNGQNFCGLTFHNKYIDNGQNCISASENCL